MLEVADARKWVRYQDLVGAGEPRQHARRCSYASRDVACRSPPARGERPHGELRLHGYPRKRHMRYSAYGVHACYGPSCCSSTTSSLGPEASDAEVAPRTCSGAATEVNRQLLGQDFHLLDDDALSRRP